MAICVSFMKTVYSVHLNACWLTVLFTWCLISIILINFTVLAPCLQCGWQGFLSHSVEWLFTLLMISFALQKLLTVTQADLSVPRVNFCDISVPYKKLFPILSLEEQKKIYSIRKVGNQLGSSKWLFQHYRSSWRYIEWSSY